MTTKLIQRHLLIGTREFELVDDHVNVRTRLPFRKEEVLQVMLTVLDPEPVMRNSCLDFNSRVNGEPLISLYLGKPSTEAFNAFVGALKEKAREEFRAFAGLRRNMPSGATSANVDEESPKVEGSDQDHVEKARQDLDPEKIDEAVQMLKKYLDPEDTGSLVAALEALKDDLKNETLLVQVVVAFDEVGPKQGAVLTYAPYVSIVLSDGPRKW
jgi:hypothetical protein